MHWMFPSGKRCDFPVECNIFNTNTLMDLSSTLYMVFIERFLCVLNMWMICKIRRGVWGRGQKHLQRGKSQLPMSSQHPVLWRDAEMMSWTELISLKHLILPNSQPQPYKCIYNHPIMSTLRSDSRPWSDKREVHAPVHMPRFIIKQPNSRSMHCQRYRLMVN